MKARKHFSKIGGIYFVGSLMIFLTQIVAMRILWAVSPSAAGDKDLRLIVTTIGGYIVSVPCMWWLMKLAGTPARYIENSNTQEETFEVAQSQLGFSPKSMTFGRFLIAFLMSYSLMYVSNFIGVFTTNLIANYKGAPVENPIQGMMSEISPWTALLTAVILAPLVEEILFRKMLIDHVKGYGEGVAIFLSGLMFGAMHGNLNQFAYAFSLGMFFGFIYVKTGKLRYTIFLHAGVNFFGSIPGIVLMKSDVFEKISSFTGSVSEMGALLAEHGQTVVLIYAYLMLIGAMVIGGLVCWVISLRKLHCQPGLLKEMGLKNGGKLKVMMLNVGMIAYFLFWIVQMVNQAMR